MHYATDWEATRETVWIRDRERCTNCGVDQEHAVLDVHHVVPRGQGGSDRLSNLVLLCRRCHDAAHRNGRAPTVDFRSTGKMDDKEFSLYRRFFNEVPSARYDSEKKVWRIPVADMEWFIESLDALPAAKNEEHIEG